jgi:hypothetical protein
MNIRAIRSFSSQTLSIVSIGSRQDRLEGDVPFRNPVRLSAMIDSRIPRFSQAVQAAALVLAFGLGMGVRTEEGVRALEEILGFQEFLRRVEAPQYARMITSPDLFEKYLPYAMALKAEDRWAKAFDGLYRQPPDWYRGSSPGVAFQASTFASDQRQKPQSAS